MPRVPRPDRTPGATLFLRGAVALAWLGSVALLVADVVRQESVLASGGLVATVGAATALVGERLGLDLPPRGPAEPSLRAYALGSFVRASAWLVLAWEQSRGTLGLPALGDVPLAVQTIGMAVAVLVVSPYRSLVRSLRLGLDALLATFGVVVALWVLEIGPAVGFDLGSGRVLAGLVLCSVLTLQVVLVALVVVREPVTSGPTSVLGVALVVAAEMGLVVTGVTAGPADGGRHVPWPLALGWCLGWAVTVREMLYNRSVPADLVPVDTAERREIRSTDLATGVVVVSLVVSVLGVLLFPQPGRAVPGGLVTAASVLVAVGLFAARESLLGRLRARLTTQLRWQARIDPLTGLVNRRGLTDRLRRIPPGAEWSVLALDLDGFKAVNDVHGHAAGDEVLVVVAEALRALAPDAGVAARTGGDEFAVLTPGDVDAGRQLGNRIAAAVREQVAGLGLGPRITVSVGVGRVDPAPGTGPGRRGRGTAPAAPDRLVAVVEAAAALQAAKALGRDRVQVYPGLVARQRERRLLLEARLPQALADGSVTAVGQPIVDLRTGVVVAVEALARWDDDLLGQVPPAEFVVVAERSGLVPELGRCVLTSAVEGYREHGLVGSGLRLAVNVSPLELRGPGYIDGLADVLARTGMPARDLVVEVTEAVVIEAGDPAVRVLSAINDLGVQVAIDDFGTGYSALGYLRRLPVQALKVDKSLVGEALTSVRTRQIVSGVVDLARRLGLVVTLEGIEDGDTARLAVDLGADQGQGYWFGRPVTWDLVALAASQERPGAAAG